MLDLDKNKMLHELLNISHNEFLDSISGKTKLDYTTVEILITKYKCPSCNGFNEFEDDVCMSCGNKLDLSKYYY